MQHILALSRTAVIVRHWFEVDLQNSSMEHGVRIELRKLPERPHRGSESAAQLVLVDQPLWRADLFDRHTDPPGSFGVAHFHPQFEGNEPCDRVWDPRLQEDPWSWLEAQFAELGAVDGRQPWQVPVVDATDLRQLAGAIVAAAKQFAPTECTSARQCSELTKDVRDAVHLMLGSLEHPELLDEFWVKPWRETA
jgi:hypothetical protein